MINEIHDFYTGKNILVVGGNGYLGSNLIDILKKIDCKISILDKINNQKVESGSIAELESFISDIRDPNIWDEILEGIDLVFYFAGQTSVYKANENPMDDFAINVQPLFNLLETCRIEKWRPGILFAGTVTELGIPENLPVNEINQDNPVTVYDLHKLTAENYLKYYANSDFVKGVILRLANVYGPGVESSSSDRGILNMMILRAMRGEDITIYGKGEFIRDYIYIDDVISAFLHSAMNLNVVNGKFFIVGSGYGHTIREAFELIKDNVTGITKKRVKIVSVPTPGNLSPIESRNFIADSKQLKDLLGWSPKTKLSSGIIKTINYYL